MICFSFDDGRKDTYTRAYPIIEKYGLTGTIHVTTGFIDGTFKEESWPSAQMGPMTIEELKLCAAGGMEITSHGDRHMTEKKDLRRSLKKLREWGLIKGPQAAFSVPHSKVPEKSERIYLASQLYYAREGRARACYSFFRKILYVLQAVFPLKYAFYLFNKPNIIKAEELTPYHLTATVIKNHNTARQIIYFIKKTNVKENMNILMFHSILYKEDPGYGQDSWYFDAEEFEKLCQWLCRHQEIEVVTIEEGVRRCLQKNGE